MRTRSSSILLGVFCIGLLASCALPAPEPEQAFVPKSDLDVVSLVREGMANFKKSRFIDAEFSFRRALYRYPSAPNVKANLAAALRSSGQFDEAEDILLALNASAPKSQEYLDALGRLYFDKKDYQAARKYYGLGFERAMDKPDLAAAARFSRNLASVAFIMGDEAAALCYSEVAFGIKSDAEELRRHSRLLLGANKLLVARSILQSFLNKPGATRDPGLLHQLAVAQFALGNYRETAELEESVIDTPDIEPAVQAEGRLLLALAQRHQHALTSSTEEVVEITQKAQTALLEEAGAELISGALKASLYWPESVVLEVEAIGVETAGAKVS